MSLGTSFLNVFDTPASDDDPDDRKLREAVGPLNDTSAPRVIWIARVVRLRQYFDIPRSVTLSFAPGARLVIENSFVIRGFLDAGLETRFELVGDGVVELLGPLDEIVADWWLPSNGRNSVEHALHALWTRYAYADARPDEGILPAPIRLDGPYALTRTLRLLPPAEIIGRVDVVFRGQHGRSLDPPTFVPGALTGDLAALVSVERGVVLLMEHVAFDLGASGKERAHRVATCLSLEGQFHGSRIEACSFAFDDMAIQANPIGQAARELLAGTAQALGLGVVAGLLLAGAEAIQRAQGRAARLALSRCVFSGTRDTARAIQVDLGAPTSLTVRDCQFTGTYAHAISMLGGELDVTACSFSNDAPPAPTPFERADILTRALDSGLDVDRNIPLANTHLTVTHCVSTSPTFLVLDQAFPYAETILGGAVLTNVRHTPATTNGVSLRLGFGAPPRALMLQGCRFGGTVVCDPSSVNYAVVDLGTRFVGAAGFRNCTPVTLATECRA